ARRRTGLEVVTVGISLGAAAVLLEAGTAGGVAGVVAISAPAFTTWERPGAARLHRLVRGRGGRLLAKTLLRTRIGTPLGRRVDSSGVIA
ncbi:hypothetical protein ACMWP8_28230, partial [Escherichia coli]|uniref:hypothetical protein n=1 Tax=Escherichia coli TaxID=562 RepID=UPI0039E01119